MVHLVLKVVDGFRIPKVGKEVLGGCFACFQAPALCSGPGSVKVEGLGLICIHHHDIKLAADVLGMWVKGVDGQELEWPRKVIAV